MCIREKERERDTGGGGGEREHYLPLSMTSPEQSGYSGTHPGSVLAVTKICGK